MQQQQTILSTDQVLVTGLLLLMCVCAMCSNTDDDSVFFLFSPLPILHSHNERKVTCKHPVSGLPSQDNCIFVVNEQ